MTILKSLISRPTTQAISTPTSSARREFGEDAIRMTDLPITDPLVQYLQSVNGAVDIGTLKFESPVLNALRKSGAKLIMPLVSQGELVGLLNLGPRMSEQDYSADDRGLLNNLASQAGPAVRVAQLVRQQKIEAREMERLAQELQVARLIQQTLLPKENPNLPGWQIASHYQPARAVGGDFYDFFERPDGKLVITIGDVTDKGVPAALVMATTRAVLRGASRRMLSPGDALERSNNLILPEIPPSMFITCLYAILDPVSGRLQFANAGHDLPYRRCDAKVEELRATGMPLGLMPDMKYEEKQIMLDPGDMLLLYTDGLVEAHNPKHVMFGFPHLHDLLQTSDAEKGGDLINHLLDELANFTGAGWEQEDDVTLVTLHREGNAKRFSMTDKTEEWITLKEFTVPSEPGNERIAMKQVAEAIQSLDLAAPQVERLKTAVSEATMNAIEYGNKNNPELMVIVRVLSSRNKLAVRISDQGGHQEIPQAPVPNLQAKLAGEQSPRGWGLFLIKNLVDEMNIIPTADNNTFELVLYLEGGKHGS
ncbi:MAG: SpoIIE family protein phosphatase [Chloroflexi bacterium]|nr:SpoIIE family protein phosphatase [Chloroflexota bacterium]